MGTRTKRDYCDVLSLLKETTEDEAKRAQRRAAIQRHLNNNRTDSRVATHPSAERLFR
ncbi:MAG: hypothetical protein NZ988_05685 [Thaumarchaeota archaeon]|nr:hypothetical protein [Candidatus Calditenuaceae archaeon]MDW8187513.1 hypothetical protein [Nitrososphaerota archaeon]